MGIFSHSFYEYRKGVRNLAIYTGNLGHKDRIEIRLKSENVDYHIQQVSDNKINVFFGDRECVELVRAMGFRSLSELTDEEDFILGIMLGYDRLKQCQRYLRRKQQNR